MEDPVERISSSEFRGPCYIDTDFRSVSTEGSPDLSATLTEGDGRTLIFS
jgi:hypothetical protein